MVGLAAGALVHNVLVYLVVYAAALVAAVPFLDRRLVGLDAEGVVQARAGYPGQPGKMLAPLEFRAVKVVGEGVAGGDLSDRPTFRIEGANYRGQRGSNALGEALLRARFQELRVEVRNILGIAEPNGRVPSDEHGDPGARIARLLLTGKPRSDEELVGPAEEWNSSADPSAVAAALRSLGEQFRATNSG